MQKYIIFISIVALSILFIIAFSYSTSFLYPYYYGNDSAQFITIGKAWYYGKIPYLDMFDHKGPLIFFIDLVGYMISWGGGKRNYWNNDYTNFLHDNNFIWYLLYCQTLFRK